MIKLDLFTMYLGAASVFLALELLVFVTVVGRFTVGKAESSGSMSPTITVLALCSAFLEFSSISLLTCNSKRQKSVHHTKTLNYNMYLKWVVLQNINTPTQHFWISEGGGGVFACLDKISDREGMFVGLDFKGMGFEHKICKFTKML